MVSTFGVIFDPAKQQFDWNQFRAFARLDKKSDESLEKYFSCFVAMCRRVCRMPAKPDDGKSPGMRRGGRAGHRFPRDAGGVGMGAWRGPEGAEGSPGMQAVRGQPGMGEAGRARGPPAAPLDDTRSSCAEPPDLSSAIEPITEERASRTLYRIELLRRIREQVLHHPQLAERLKLCQPSLDLPEWWECGRHDRDLLVGAAKHGVSRTDYHILNDPELSFLDAHKNFAQARGAGGTPALNPLALGFGQTPAATPAAPGQEDKAGAAEAKAREASEKPEGKEEEEAEGSGKDQRQDREAELGAGKSEPRGVEVGVDSGPKSISEKGSEEDEEEKLEDDDKSEESSQPEGKT